MPGFGEVGQEGGVVTPKWHVGWKAAQDFTAKCQRTIDSHDPHGVAYAIQTRVTLGFRLISREHARCERLPQTLFCFRQHDLILSCSLRQIQIFISPAE
jgi:hypothetical protein